MRSVTELPGGYAPLMKIDMQKDKKAALVVNGGSVLVMAALWIAGCFIVPFSAFFQSGDLPFFLKPVLLILSFCLYMVLHEAVHGIFMKGFGAKKVKFGFTGLYAYAGSNDYFYKKPYITIALAPVVFWGLVLLVLNCLADKFWFWNIYFIQVGNLAGAAGDIYVTCKLLKMPSNILIRDTGVAMEVYGRTE